MVTEFHTASQFLAEPLLVAFFFFIAATRYLKNNLRQEGRVSRGSQLLHLCEGSLAADL